MKAPGFDAGGFVGRGAELALLANLLRALHAGQGFIATITGEAGIGKTRLLAEAMKSSPPLDHAQARANPLETHAAFAVLRSALKISRNRDPIARQISSQLSSPETSWESVFRVVELFVDLAEARARNTPLLLLLDDLQWVDAMTPRVLLRLGDLSQFMPIGVVTSRRPYPLRDEARIALEDLHRNGGVEIELHPLPPNDAMTLAKQELPRASRAIVSESVQRAGGNPLLIVELAASLREASPVKQLRSRPPTADLTAVLKNAVLERVRDLPESSQDILRLASILGPRFSSADLEQLADVPGELSDLLRPAFSSCVIREGEAGMSFSHDLVWECLYHAVDPAARSAMHRKAAQALETSGRSGSHLAIHLIRGAEPENREAAEKLLQTGRHLAATNPYEAVGLLERALEIWSSSDHLRAAILITIVAPYTWLGRLEDADRCARLALALSTSREDRQALISDFVHTLFYQGRFDEALELLHELPGDDNVEAQEKRAKALAEMAFAMAYVDTARADNLCTEVLDNQTVAPSTRTIALMASSEIANARGRIDVALEFAREAMSAASEDPTGEAKRNQPRLGYVSSQVFLDQPGDVLREIETASLEGRGLETAWHEPVADALAAYWAFSAGEWNLCVDRASAALKQSIEWGLLHEAGGPTSCGVLVATLLHRDQAAEAAKALRLFGERGGAAQYLVAWARALILERHGDLEGATRVIGQAWKVELARGRGMVALICGADYSRFLAGLGDVRAMKDVSSVVSDFAEVMGSHTGRAIAHRVGAIANDDLGEGVLAIKHFEKTYRRPELAFACEETGQRMIRHKGSTDDAVFLLRRAAALYDLIGADVRLRAVRQTLREAGATPPQSKRRPQAGWDSITATEHRVLDLICEGLTNREIADRLVVGKRTVETHVAHLFRKLDVSSRGALIAKAHSHSREANFK